MDQPPRYRIEYRIPDRDAVVLASMDSPAEAVRLLRLHWELRREKGARGEVVLVDQWRGEDVSSWGLQPPGDA